MPQLNKGDTFADGQQVTGTRLNNLIDGATLLVGAIADQTGITANTLESTDTLLVNDAGVLKKATVGDVLNSNLDANLDVVTAVTLKSGQIEGVLESDVNLVPQDGTTISGKTFTSIDGITAIVTSTAHGLVTNMLLTFTASNAVYNGTYLITVLSVDTFSYVISQTTPVAASGTLSYVKKGSVNVDGNVYVSEELNVVGQTNLDNVTASGNLTSSGVANFTGTFQVGGTVGYALTEIVEQNMSYTGSPSGGSWTACFTSASYTKPVGEIWVLEVDFRFRTEAQHYTVFRFQQTTPSVTLNGVYNIEGAGSNYYHCENAMLRYVFQDATTFTSTFTLDAYPTSTHTITIGEAAFPYTPPYFTGVTLPVSKFRIYKYKTA